MKTIEGHNNNFLYRKNYNNGEITLNKNFIDFILENGITNKKDIFISTVEFASINGDKGYTEKGLILLNEYLKLIQERNNSKSFSNQSEEVYEKIFNYLSKI